MKNPTYSLRPLSGALLLLAFSAVPLQAQLSVPFGSGGDTFTMDFVPIGNPGNAGDTTGVPNPAGSVAYGYWMGKTEVSRDMITKASSAGSLGITMSDMTSYGGNGVNRPATGVSWNEAASFVNWLNTSTGHSVAYKFSSSTLVLWSSGDAGYNAANPYRNSQAYYVLPSEDEWYKAAYYDSGKASGAGYWNYPTGSDSPPSAVAGGTGAGTAVYNLQTGPANVANAGGLSPSGTMGQGGNAWEWMESAHDQVNDTSGESRGVRGGYWNDPASFLASAIWLSIDPANESSILGLRVAAVPEPLESGGVIGLVALGFALWRRRGSL